MSLILQKICEHLHRIAKMPAPELYPQIATPDERSELWSMAKDIFKMYPLGSVGREGIVGVFLTRIEENPTLIARLQPATNTFHYELVHAIMIHPRLTEFIRSKMLENPEITAALL